MSEISFKQWISEQAARYGISRSGMLQRFYTKRCEIPRLRRVNKRVVMVVVVDDLLVIPSTL